MNNVVEFNQAKIYEKKLKEYKCMPEFEAIITRLIDSCSNYEQNKKDVGHTITTFYFDDNSLIKVETWKEGRMEAVTGFWADPDEEDEDED